MTLNGPDLTESSRPRGKGRPRTVETAAPSLVELLNLVRTGAANTRQGLECQSEFGRAVVADRLTMLGDLGLVDESELGTATGGRAPRLVRFAARRAAILVATLDQTAIGVGVADLSGKLLTEHHEAADLTAPPAELAERLTALFRWSMERHAPQGSIWGISLSVVPTGIGLALIRETGPLTAGLLLAGRIGAGIVCDGQLYRGAHGAAGLIGSLPVTSGGRSGPLDTLAGSDMIQREGLAAAQDGRSPMLADIQRRGGDISAIEVSQAAQTGDPASVAILTDSGHLIGQVVATLANALNPELIVLSGSIVQTNDILLAALREAVYGASHPFVTRDLRIIRSQMGSSAGLVGAARVASEQLFAPGFLKEWVMQGSPIAHPAFAALHDRLSQTASPPPPLSARIGQELPK